MSIVDFDFTGLTALITGSTGAIGKAIAKAMVERGGRVFITDLKQDMVEQVVAELGDSAAGLAADVCCEDSVKAVVTAAEEFFGGKLDILINCAGIIGQAPIADMTVDAWDQMVAVNGRGTFLFCKYCVPIMRKGERGKIVNFSSKTGKTGSALMAHYSFAKAGIMGLTQALAYELAGDKINVNCVCPGITDDTGVWTQCSADYIDNLGKSREEVVAQFTAKIPLKRLASVWDVVSMCLFLSLPMSDYMTGQSINITGGREMH